MTRRKVVITGSQHHRDPGDPLPASPPTDWEALRQMDETALREIGLRRWDGDLWLFPAEWHSHIPEGFEIVNLFGKKTRFKRGVTSDDMRFGCLSFGILIKKGG